MSNEAGGNISPAGCTDSPDLPGPDSILPAHLFPEIAEFMANFNRDFPITGQLQSAKGKTLGREIDAIVVYIGGNDIKFAKLIEAFITEEPCHQEVEVEVTP